MWLILLLVHGISSMQLLTSGSSFLLTCYIGYWCPYHYGCEDCPQIGCSNPWYPWLHIDFNVCPPNVRLYPLTWPSSNLVIKLDDQFQLLVAELWQLRGKYNRSIPYQSSMWLIVPIKCPSVAIRFHNKGGSRHRSVSSHQYVFFSYCTNFLNNYRYLDNTRGWQTTRTIWPPIPAPRHITTTGTPPSSMCWLPLWHFGKVLNTMNQSSIPLFQQSQLSSYDRSFQPGLETGRWSSCELYLCLAWISTISYLFFV